MKSINIQQLKWTGFDKELDGGSQGEQSSQVPGNQKSDSSDINLEMDFQKEQETRMKEAQASTLMHVD